MSANDKAKRREKMKELKEQSERRRAEERVEAELRREGKLRPDEKLEFKTQEEIKALEAKMSAIKAAAEGGAGEAEAEAAGEAAAAAALQPKPEPKEPEAVELTVEFKEARWGMRTLLKAPAPAPLVISTVFKGGEASELNVLAGDEIVSVNDVKTDEDREKVIELVKKGGPAKVVVRRTEGAKPVLVGVNDGATTVVKGEGMSASDQARLQAMIGQAKSNDSTAYVGRKGEKEEITKEEVKPSATLIFANCQDCEFEVTAMTTKVFVQGCQNTSITIRNKVLTAVVEVYKSKGINLHYHVNCGTLQVDMSDDVAVKFAKREHFLEEKDPDEKESAGSIAGGHHKNTAMIVWAGCQNLSVDVGGDANDKLTTSFDEMSTQFPDLNMERSQFRIQYKKSLAGEYSLHQEPIVRLENGFFSTQQERDAFNARQEKNMKALAESMGITVPRARTKKPKFKPNEMCPVGRGLKYKKCCNRSDRTCASQNEDGTVCEAGAAASEELF